MGRGLGEKRDQNDDLERAFNEIREEYLSATGRSKPQLGGASEKARRPEPFQRRWESRERSASRR
jgi:hypothetical protein